MGATLYSNDYIELVEDNGVVQLHVLNAGYTIQEFNTEVSVLVPRLKITKFTALSSALRDSITGYIEIGELLDVVQLSVASDGMTAQVTILLTEEEYASYDKKELLAKVVRICNEQSIVYGLDATRFVTEMKPMVAIDVAEGLLPIPGDDAVVTMYEMSAVEPTIEAAGGVDHYELNVINKAVEGDWLGNRLEPTEGTPGKDIHGQDVKAKAGMQEPLLFDPNTVVSVFDEKENKTTLKALKDGAVVFSGDTVMILNAINIDGDVSFATGNIEFDGFVEVSDTIEDNFSVIATENIQILGNMGIGAVSLVESKEGDVYIRGGIAGKGKAHIKAKKNVYTKFASDCVIECGGTVNIGFYAMNCDIKATEVILESDTSKIIGGVTEADVKVIAGEIGSRAGIQTKIKINGFDRVKLEEDYSRLSAAIELTKEKEAKAQSSLEGYKKRVIRQSEYEVYEATRQKYLNYKKQLESLYEAQKNYVSYLQAKGVGEIIAKKGIYANVFMEMLDDRYLTTDACLLPMHYYYLDDQIKGID